MTVISLATAELPGYGLLFEEREHLLQTIHLSLREFLLDANRSGSYAANVGRGHLILTQSCLQIMLGRTTGPTLAYALRHGHGHLTEVIDHHLATVLSHSSMESIAVVHEWFCAFLHPRIPMGTGAKSDCGARDQMFSAHQPELEPAAQPEHVTVGCGHDLIDEVEPEPELEQELQADRNAKPPRSYNLSLWRARGAVADWLCAQVSSNW